MLELQHGESAMQPGSELDAVIDSLLFGAGRQSIPRWSSDTQASFELGQKLKALGWHISLGSSGPDACYALLTKDDRRHMKTAQSHATALALAALDALQPAAVPGK